MRFLPIKIVFLWSVLLFSLSADIETLADAIRMARSQSVLTQKILSDYSMIGMHNHFQHAEQTFTEDIEAFDTNLEALDAFATSKEAFQNIEKTREAWESMKILLKQKGSREQAVALLKQLDVLLILCKESTKLYSRQTGSMLGKIIDDAADLGIDAQRMAVLYLLKAWGVSNDATVKEMHAIMKRFQSAIARLEEARINTPEIVSVLKKVKRDFLYFTMMDSLGSSMIPTLIYKKSNTILQSANQLALLYNKTITLN